MKAKLNISAISRDMLEIFQPLFKTCPNHLGSWLKQYRNWYVINMLLTYFLVIVFSERKFIVFLFALLELMAITIWNVKFTTDHEIPRDQLVRTAIRTITTPLMQWFGGKTPTYIIVLHCMFLGYIRQDIRLYGRLLSWISIFTNYITMVFLGGYSHREAFPIIFILYLLNTNWNWLIIYIVDKEEKAEFENKCYNQLVESIDEILIRLDENGFVTYGNSQSETIWKNSHGISICMAPFFDIDHLHEVLVYGSKELWTWNFDKKVYLIRATPIISQFGKTGATILISDISSETEAHEAELKSIKALEALKSKVEFIASISHELRNPLQSIVYSLDNMEFTNLSRSQIELTNDIRNSADLLKSIIGDVLDMSRIEVGKMKCTNEKVDVLQVVETALEINSVPAIAKGLKLQSFVDLEIPRFLTGDPGRIVQIISNFVTNAIKFTKQGSIIIKVEKDFEFIKFNVIDTGIGIQNKDLDSVFDPFVQIDEEKTPTTFRGFGLGLPIARAFVHEMNGNIGVQSTLRQGSTFWFTIPIDPSLGFPTLKSHFQTLTSACQNLFCFSEDRMVMEYIQQICFALKITFNEKEVYDKDCDAVLIFDPYPLEMLKNCPNVWISMAISEDSAYNYSKLPNCKFWKTPFRITEFLRLVNGKSSTLVKSSMKKHGLVSRVLFVEDNLLVHKTLDRLLKNFNIPIVMGAYDGVDALEIVKNQDPFDVILMDIQMEKMDGMECTRNIRKLEPPKSNVPVYLCTGNPLSIAILAESNELKICDVLSKPITKDTLCQILQKEVVNECRAEKFRKMK